MADRRFSPGPKGRRYMGWKVGWGLQNADTMLTLSVNALSVNALSVNALSVNAN